MKKLEKFTLLLPFIVCFIMYIITLAPSVLQIDAGELATVQITFGIAHPSGYPLFTILGYLFSKLPIFASKIYQMNFLAAIFTASGIFLFTMFCKDLLFSYNLKFQATQKNSKDKKAKKIPTKEMYNGTIYFALISALFLGLSKTFWFQSTSVEVYSLHILLLGLNIYTFFYAYSSSNRFPWLIFAFTFALGFLNHLTTFLLIPGFAVLYFWQYKFKKETFIHIIQMLLIFTPLLLIGYSVLYLNSSKNPTLNWGNPSNLENLIRHIKGWQYQVWLFSSSEVFNNNLSKFFSNLSDEFFLPFFILVLSGIYYSIRNYRKIGIFLLITFISTIIYSCNYNIHDIDSYFILAYFCFATWSLYGCLFVFNQFNFLTKYLNIFYIFVALIIFVEAYNSFGAVNQNDNYAFADYTKAAMNSCNKNSLILTYQWDYLVSPSLYFQNVEHFRKDIIIIDKELLRRSWYYNQLSTNYSKLITKVDTIKNQFLEELHPFERSQEFNAERLENLYRTIQQKLITTNYNEKTCYIGPEFLSNEMQKGEFTLPNDFQIVPDLFFFKVVKTMDYVPAANPDYKIRIPKNKDSYTKFIENLCGEMLIRRAMYEIQFNKIDRAKVYYNKIKNDFKDFPIPTDLIKILG